MSFVGAMKIARNVAVSGRYDEWYAPFPAPSEREPGNVPHNVNHPPAGCFVSGRVIFGVCVGFMFCHSTGCLRNREVGGRLSSPLRRAGSIHRTTLPQSRIRSTAPSEREPGNAPPQCQSPARWMFCQRAGDFWWFCVGGIFHSTGYLRNRGGAGDFHRPYETLNV